ncbi:MAG: SRPBCC domain-containing protein [Thermoplasmatota archaeon]
MPTDPGAILVSSRLFPFPPSRVYAAFANPATLGRWWGPNGAVNTFHEFDLRPGGEWRFTMEGPWGRLPMRKTFTAVEPGKRIAIRHEQEGHTFVLDMLMEPAAGGTRLTWTTTFESAQQLATVREAFAKGNEENFDRLLATLEAATKPGND